MLSLLKVHKHEHHTSSNGSVKIISTYDKGWGVGGQFTQRHDF